SIPVSHQWKGCRLQQSLPCLHSVLLCLRSAWSGILFLMKDQAYICATVNIRIMKAVIQRVSRASVTIEGSIHSQIKLGLLVLMGIEDADTDEDIEWLSSKIVNM